MTVPNQAAPGSSPAPSQNPTAASTDWEAQKARYEAQLRGLSEERNQYKMKADAWTRLAQDPYAQGAIRFDPATGLPVDWDRTPEPTPMGGGNQSPYPFQELGIDPNAASQWVASETQRLLANQGYITQAQAEQLAAQKATQAYQMANQRFMTQRAVDKTLSSPLYKDLANADSEWAKRTASYLQQYNAGRPLREGASWDEWDYTGPQVLQQAADIAWAQMQREAQASQTSQQQAIQNQQAAGLSAPAGASPQPMNSSQQFDRVLAEGDTKAVLDALAGKVNESFQAAGLLTP